MDVNNTRFHLLQGRDWERMLGASDHASLALDDACNLTLRPLLPRSPLQSDWCDRPLMRAAARDHHGTWYWIDERGAAVWRLRADGAQPERLWPHHGSHPFVGRLRGLALAGGQRLVVGVQEWGLLLFDLAAGGEPAQVRMGSFFRPVDMASGPDESVWVLDGGLTPHLWCFFSQEEGPAGFTFHQPYPLPLDSPVAVESLPDGSLLLLDAGGQEALPAIVRFQDGMVLGRADLAMASEELDPVPEGYWTFQPCDLTALVACDGEALSGMLYLSAPGEGQAFGFRLEADLNRLNLTLDYRYLPLRGATGCGLVRAGEQVHYAAGTTWPALRAVELERYASEGLLLTEYLDGKERDCVWHRIVIDAEIPPGTSISLETRARNRRDLLHDLPFQKEPTPYLRPDGSELPYYRAYPPEAGGAGWRGSWELLIGASRGQFLQLQITLHGRGNTTPRIRALRVHYPRFSYLANYLPALYQEDQRSASFLERYLANLEGIWTSLEGRIAEAQLLFDARTTPAEYLPWLASWVGLSLDAGWDERRQRLFVAHAVTMFKQRGTLPGLVRALRLATDPFPAERLFQEPVTRYLTWPPQRGERPLFRIVEEFRLGQSQQGPLLDLPKAWRGQRLRARAYRNFLRSRYGHIGKLASTYQLAGRAGKVGLDFHQLEPPESPRTAVESQDLDEFQARIWPMIRRAHRFRVLVDQAQARPGLLELIRRVVALEKPAHTECDVSYIGEVTRLVLGRGQLGIHRLGDR